ncbi:MAG: hypothetical protein K6A23_14485, partial [Butyrivibrio sp.]|nr:hypothetical protein [Butyrivibrio sp.]
KLLVREMSKFLQTSYAEIEKSGVAEDKEEDEKEIVYKDEIRKDQEKGQFVYDGNKVVKVEVKEDLNFVEEEKPVENKPEEEKLEEEKPEEKKFEEEKHRDEFFRIKFNINRYKKEAANKKRSKDDVDIADRNYFKEKYSSDEIDMAIAKVESKEKSAGMAIVNKINAMKESISDFRTNLHAFVNKQNSDLNDMMLIIESTKKQGHQNSTNYFVPVQNALDQLKEIDFSSGTPNHRTFMSTLEKYDNLISAADRYVNHYDWWKFNVFKSSEGNTRRDRMRDFAAVVKQKKEEFKNNYYKDKLYDSINAFSYNNYSKFTINQLDSMFSEVERCKRLVKTKSSSILENKKLTDSLNNIEKFYNEYKILRYNAISEGFSRGESQDDVCKMTLGEMIEKQVDSKIQKISLDKLEKKENRKKEELKTDTIGSLRKEMADTRKKAMEAKEEEREKKLKAAKDKAKIVKNPNPLVN